MSELLSLRGVSFRYRGAPEDALREVDLSVGEGETLGIVGESGSGKSTALSVMLGIRSPASGEVRFQDRPLRLRDHGQVRQLRRRVQPVFQDPYASLDPRQRVDAIVGEPLTALRLERGAAPRRERAAAALAEVGLSADVLTRYPHEFSGGQRQRIAIARALVTGPDLLVADEPVSALDVTTRVEVIKLLEKLHVERRLGLVIVSHDVSIIAALCSSVAVMREGRVIEAGATMDVLRAPTQEYTRQLISAIPRLPGPVDGSGRQTS